MDLLPPSPLKRKARRVLFLNRREVLLDQNGTYYLLLGELTVVPNLSHCFFGRWRAELLEFSRNLKRFGRDWKKIAEYMPRCSIEELKARWQVNRASKSKPPLAGNASTGSAPTTNDRKRKSEPEAVESKAAKIEPHVSPRGK